MNLQAMPYPNGMISDELRSAAWNLDGNESCYTPYFPFQGMAANWQAVMQSVDAHFTAGKRQALVDTLLKQHYGFAKPQQIANIQALLQSNSYAVTTGQQIHLGLGPLYVFYKILSAIIVSNDLSNRFPDKKFIPIFWMATEDHDFEEIRHTDLWGDRFSWQQNKGGAVGLLSTESLHDFVNWSKKKCGDNQQALIWLDEMADCYLRESQTLGPATAHWVSKLFGDKGLLVLDPLANPLKQMAKSLFYSDLFENTVGTAFKEQTQAMKQSGIETPASSREINLFWLDVEKRERLVKTTTGFETVGSKFSLTNEEMMIELDKNPEKLSPNVLLRPLYQQSILPNVAYVAGSTEYLYWLQTAKAFGVHSIPTPVLLHRMSGIVLTQIQQKRLAKMDIEMSEAFMGLEDLKVKITERALGKNPLSESFQMIELEMQQYLKILYQWKSPALKNFKKLANDWLKIQKKNTDEAVDHFVELQLTEDLWEQLKKILHDDFNIKSPQDRNMGCLQYLLNGGFAKLQNWCNCSEYSHENSFVQLS